MQLKDKGSVEYSLIDLPISPRSYGKPSSSKPQPILELIKIIDGSFVKAGTLAEETDDKDVLQWLYKDEPESQPEVNNVSILVEQYGKGYDIMRKMGYGGSGPVGKRKEGISKPIQPPSQLPKDKSKLGYG